MMLETWLIEMAKGIGKFFLNPLSYWALFLFLLTGYKRVKMERKQFSTKIFNLFAEGQKTLIISIAFSIILSIITVFSGIVLTFETILLIIVVTVLVSITGSTTFLSASYTIGMTFILLLILPFLQLSAIESFIGFNNISLIHFISLAILAGVFLLIEAILVSRKTNRQTFPHLTLSHRGIWIGQHHIKGLAFIPFFVLMPIDKLSGIAPFWPYFHYGEQSFSLVFIPFLLGFHYRVQGELPNIAAQRVGYATFWLSLLVLACAFSSLFFPYLAFAAIFIAIIGKEWITYRHKLKDKKKPAFFSPLNKGIKVLATIPNGPADRLGIVVGETILKVNGNIVTNPTQFYEALQNSGAFFKLDVLDHKGEVRFINSALYEEDHHELGIIFPEKPDNQ